MPDFTYVKTQSDYEALYKEARAAGQNYATVRLIVNEGFFGRRRFKKQAPISAKFLDCTIKMHEENKIIYVEVDGPTSGVYHWTEWAHKRGFRFD